VVVKSATIDFQLELPDLLLLQLAYFFLAEVLHLELLKFMLEQAENLAVLFAELPLQRILLPQVVLQVLQSCRQSLYLDVLELDLAVGPSDLLVEPLLRAILLVLQLSLQLCLQ